ncbi:hypothetical protein B566_EDAN012884, partial [Ephemera danica]
MTTYMNESDLHLAKAMVGMDLAGGGKPKKTVVGRVQEKVFSSAKWNGEMSG